MTEAPKPNAAWAAFKRNLATGFLLVIPTYLTFWILSKLLRIADGLILLLPERYQPKAHVGFQIPGLGLLVVLLVLFGVGALATSLVGNRLVSAWERFLDRIPLVRGLYTSLKQFFHVMFSKEQKFSKVVLVQWPRPGAYVLGFVTSTAPSFAERAADKGGMVSVFYPTTPNPTTGFHFMVPAKEVVPLDITVEEAFKLIMSAGVLLPRELPPPTAASPD